MKWGKHICVFISYKKFKKFPPKCSSFENLSSRDKMKGLLLLPLTLIGVNVLAPMTMRPFSSLVQKKFESRELPKRLTLSRSEMGEPLTITMSALEEWQDNFFQQLLLAHQHPDEHPAPDPIWFSTSGNGKEKHKNPAARVSSYQRKNKRKNSRAVFFRNIILLVL
jgi:hypothetical protein